MLFCREEEERLEVSPEVLCGFHPRLSPLYCDLSVEATFARDLDTSGSREIRVTYNSDFSLKEENTTADIVDGKVDQPVAPWSPSNEAALTSD